MVDLDYRNYKIHIGSLVKVERKLPRIKFSDPRGFFLEK